MAVRADATRTPPRKAAMLDYVRSRIVLDKSPSTLCQRDIHVPAYPSEASVMKLSSDRRWKLRPRRLSDGLHDRPWHAGRAGVCHRQTHSGWRSGRRDPVGSVAGRRSCAWRVRPGGASLTATSARPSGWRPGRATAWLSEDAELQGFLTTGRLVIPDDDPVAGAGATGNDRRESAADRNTVANRSATNRARRAAARGRAEPRRR